MIYIPTERPTFHYPDGSSRPPTTYPVAVRVPRAEIPSDIKDRYAWWRPVYQIEDINLLAKWGPYGIELFVGFLTDYASVPLLLWPLSAWFAGPTEHIAPFHDGFYRCHDHFCQQFDCTEKEWKLWADQFYLQGCLANGTRRGIARFEYRSLRRLGRMGDGATNPAGLITITRLDSGQGAA